MPGVSVLIPTHGHRAATLPFAVTSVQAQGIDDIEILIVGDGVDDSVRSTVEHLQANDPRIRFFDFPKGPRNGEIHRDGVLRQARGRIICYQADDDLWLPGHLSDMQAALEDADFVGAMHVNVELEGRLHAYFFDIERPEFRDRWASWQAHPYGPWASMVLAWHSPGTGWRRICACPRAGPLRRPGWRPISSCGRSLRANPGAEFAPCHGLSRCTSPH